MSCSMTAAYNVGKFNLSVYKWDEFVKLVCSNPTASQKVINVISKLLESEQIL